MSPSLRQDAQGLFAEASLTSSASRRSSVHRARSRYSNILIQLKHSCICCYTEDAGGS